MAKRPNLAMRTMSGAYERQHRFLQTSEPMFVPARSRGAMDLLSVKLRPRIEAHVASLHGQGAALKLFVHVEMQPQPEFWIYPLHDVVRMVSCKPLLSFARERGVALHVVGNSYQKGAHERDDEGRWQYKSHMTFTLDPEQPFGVTVQECADGPVEAVRI